MFRCKVLPLEQWALLQDQFVEIWTNVFKGDPAMALFIEAGPSGEPRTILITEKNSGSIEALSPGSWSDCGDAAERRWTLLAGHASANEDMGLPRPR